MVEDNRSAPTEPPPKKNLAVYVWSWVVVGAVALFLLGFGGNFMTSHAVIADIFFVAGILLLLVKFWTWEEAKHDDRRKRAALLVVSTLIALTLIVGACALTRYMNKPQVNTLAQAGEPKTAQPSLPTPTRLAQPSPTPVSPTLPARGARKRKNIPDPTPVPAIAPALSPPAPAPTYQQDCKDSACAQGAGSTATYNQYGAPKLVMTDDQSNAIRDAMKPYAGLKFTIFLHDATEDTKTFSDQLRRALVGAGLVPDKMDGAIGTAFGGVIPAGVSAQVGAEEVPALATLANTMKAQGLLSKPLSYSLNPVRADGFDITIAPNR